MGTEPTEIRVQRVVYEPFDDMVPDDTGCGRLVHKLYSQSYIAGAFPELITSKSGQTYQAQTSSDYLSWYIDAVSPDQIGTHTLEFQLYPQDVAVAPKENYPVFEIEILPCSLNEVTLDGNSDLVDFQMELGETVVLPFTKFTQVPACGFSMEYTLTLVESTSSPAELPESLEDESALFATLDEDFGTLTFSPVSEDYLGKSYDVFIQGHVDQ